MDSYGGNWRQQPAGFNPEPQFQPQDAPSGNPNPNPVNTSIDEGRRIYMGNLQYTLAPEDVEQFLKDADFSFTKIHMSVDDLYGRNPGYCFAEFSTKEEADRALAELPGAHLSGRAIKVGPCVPKRSDGQARFRQGGRTFDRPWQREGGWSHWGGRGGESSDRPPPQSMHRSWGDYSRDRPDGAGPGGGSDRPYQQGQTRQRDWESAERKRRTLYVGGLPRQENTASFEAEIQDMFKDFTVESISKPKNPNRGFNERPGNNYFCFIEFATEDDAAAAMQALNGAPFQGANMRISFSRS